MGIKSQRRHKKQHNGGIMRGAGPGSFVQKTLIFKTTQMYLFFSVFKLETTPIPLHDNGLSLLYQIFSCMVYLMCNFH